MDARHDDVCRIGAGADDSDRMRVASGVQTGIAAPAIRLDGASGFHGVAHKAQQTVRRDIGIRRTGPARNHGHPFRRRSRLWPCPQFPCLLRPLPAPGHRFRQPRSLHGGNRGRGESLPCAACAAKSRPSRSCPAPAHVADRRADPVLLAGDEPHRKEPRPQWFAGVLEDRAGRQRHLSATGPTAKQATRHFRRLICYPTSRTDKAVRPSQAAQVRSACRFTAEPSLELLKRPGIINPAPWGARIVHAPMLSVGARCVKGIPNCGNLVEPAPLPRISRSPPFTYSGRTRVAARMIAILPSRRNAGTLSMPAPGGDRA